MFGLPTHRTRTPGRGERPQCDEFANNPTIAYGCDPYDPKYLKSALRLAEMKWNHYTMILSQDWKNIRTWGATSTYGPAGIGGDINEPRTINILWPGGVKEDIIYMRSVGYNNGYTIFHTASGSVFGAGNNAGYILNTAAGSRNTMERILTDVQSLYLAGGQATPTMIYSKTDGKVYALGDSRPAGFGPALINTNLTLDNGANYLGIDNVQKVWMQYFVEDVTTTKSFALKNDGSVYACGYNKKGALGVNSTSDSILPWTAVVKQDGTLLTEVIDIVTTTEGDAATGNGNSTYFLTSLGEVWVCGSNNYGQLGLNLALTDNRNYVEKIPNINFAEFICTTQRGHSVLVSTKASEVYSWGRNLRGECGVGYISQGPPDNTANYVKIATQIAYPNTERITMIHGGGMYGQIDPAFTTVTSSGKVYVCGDNSTYQLGLKNPNNTIPNPVTTFTRNEFFGYGAPRRVDPGRFPLVITGGTLLSGTSVVESSTPIDFKYKTFTTQGIVKNQNVYVVPGYYVFGPGIPPETLVTKVDRINHKIYLNKLATATTTNITLSYEFYPKAWQADLCGYPNEGSMKVVSEDGTMYQSGWNQLTVNDTMWNFNPRIGTQNVFEPTTFEAAF